MRRHTFRSYITSILATLLISTHLFAPTSGLLNSEVVKDQQAAVTGSRLTGEQEAGESSCRLNGRAPVVCGMCLEIFREKEQEEQNGVNVAAKCCESEEVYDVCTNTLKELMEEEDLDESGQENWNDEIYQSDDLSSILGKNSDYHHNDITGDDNDVMQSLESEEKRGLNPFLGKRGNPFLGKRANPFLGKRRLNPFLGKRAMNPFLGKRAMNPFLGKRAMNPFLGKRRMNPFLGKRGPNPFLGKRRMNPFLGKRANPFLG